MPQFDSTTLALPYSRVMRIVIDYIAPLTAVIEVTTQEHVPLIDGSHRPLGSAATFKFQINPADLATGTVPLRDVNTGALLGMELSLMQIFGGVNAVIRDRELTHYGIPVTQAETQTDLPIGE